MTDSKKDQKRSAKRQRALAQHQHVFDLCLLQQPIVRDGGGFNLRETVSVAAAYFVLCELHTAQRVRDYFDLPSSRRTVREWPLLEEVRVFVVANFGADVERLTELGFTRRLIPPNLQQRAVSFDMRDYRRRCCHAACGRLEMDWRPFGTVLATQPDKCADLFASRASMLKYLEVARSSPTVLLKDCARCRRAWYCCTECQKQHWPEHRNSCTAHM